ncbi:hypothetical protein [Hymenobacter sp. IS2118]|uniref:hypothetical protein n=1 Tax=Hymenobacter sp. IS2118 TaxID=1505605 RepID=UPI000557673E|nr:hypothetical protein [Hymenobacter sp. IS2118]
MQELLDDINAIRLSIEALNKRVQEQGQPVSVASLERALATVLATVRAQSAPTFTLDYARIAQQIQGHLATPAALGAVLTTGTNELNAVVKQIPRSIAVEGEVMGFTNWKSAALVFFVPMLVLVLGMAMGGVFSQVSKEKYEMLQGQAQGLQDKVLGIENERNFYKAQIRSFSKSMSTTKESRQTTQQLFPAYQAQTGGTE